MNKQEQYRLLYQQARRQLNLEMKLNKAKQEQIDSLSDALASAEDQKEYLISMLSEIRDMAADEGDKRVITH